jgi:hypothetical protein
MLQAVLKRVSKRKKEEAISYISSYQTLTANKNSKSCSACTKLKKSGFVYETIAVKRFKSQYSRGREAHHSLPQGDQGCV